MRSRCKQPREKRALPRGAIDHQASLFHIDHVGIDRRFSLVWWEMNHNVYCIAYDRHENDMYVDTYDIVLQWICTSTYRDCWHWDIGNLQAYYCVVVVPASPVGTKELRVRAPAYSYAHVSI